MSKPLDINAALIRLGALGVIIERFPAEYRVTYRGGNDKTARFVETLAEAIEVGAQMAAERPEPPPPTARLKRTTRRALIRRHNQKWGARLFKQREAQRREDLRRVLEMVSFPDTN